MRFSEGFSAGDPDDVVWILFDHVGIQIDQRDAHPLGGVLRGAEDDGLRHAVGRFQIARDL